MKVRDCQVNPPPNAGFPATATPPFPAFLASDWEEAWAPYDEMTYQAVLDHLRPEDRVLDIGAGDLRLALRMVRRTAHVHALELHAKLIPSPLSLPANLSVVIGDARALPFPPDVTVGVLLMRHCRHFAHYVEKLQAVGCRRLLTNARWGMDVEEIDLSVPAQPFESLTMGWYGCRCGAVGFVPGAPEALTSELEARFHEVASCPQCASVRASREHPGYPFRRSEEAAHPIPAERSRTVSPALPTGRYSL